MTDNDVNIVFGAEVSKKSIDDAVKTAEQEAVKACAKLKPVKLSVKASTSFEAKDSDNKKEVSKIKKLNEAQSKLINHWNQQFEKGFKSSPEYKRQQKILYNDFKALSKGRHNDPQVKEITRVIGGSITRFNQEIDKQLAKTMNLTRKDIDRALKVWSDEFSNKQKSLGEKRAKEFADKKFLENLGKSKSGRKAFGTRVSNWDDTYYGVKDEKGNKPMLRQNDKVGTYFGKNSLMKQWAQNQKAFRKMAIDSLKIYNVSGYKNKDAITSLLGKKSKYSYKDTVSKDTAYANVAKVGGQLMGKTPDVAVGDLAVAVAEAITKELTSTNFQDVAVSLNRALSGTTAELMNRFKDNGIIGVNYEDEGKEKGVGINYDRWKTAMEQIMHGFSNIDVTSLKVAFDTIRGNLTKEVDNIIKQERSTENKIKKLEDKIQENVKLIGQENYSRKSITDSLKKAKTEQDRLQEQMNQLTAQRDKVKTLVSNQKTDYDKGEKEYKNSYNELKKLETDLYNEMKSKKLFSKNPETKAEKDLQSRYHETQNSVRNNPYLTLTEPYRASQLSLMKLDKEINTTTSSLQSATNKVRKYEQDLETLKTETKAETKERQNHVKQLEQENTELKQVIKELKFHKDELKGKEEEAKANLYNSENYGEIKNSLVGALAPLMNNVVGAIDNGTAYAKIENSRESAADNAEAQKNQKIISGVEADLGTGFNTDAKADQVIDALNTIKTFLTNKTVNDNAYEGVLSGISATLTSILTTINTIETNGITTRGGRGNGEKKSNIQEAMTTALSPIVKDIWLYKDQLGEDAYGRKVVYGGRERKTEVYDRGVEDFRRTTNFGRNELQEKAAYNRAETIRRNNKIEEERALIEQGKHSLQKSQGKPLDRSIVETTLMDFSKRLPKLFSQKIMATTSKEQDQMNADLIKRYGIGVGSDVRDTGDKVRFARMRSLWRGNGQLDKVFKDFKLTPGIKIDTTEITSAIAKVMSGTAMFKAQSGGWLNNLAIAGTGGLAARFQPSLEKTRAQADAINTIMADMREKFNTVIQDILDKESALSGMQEKGDITFNEDGSIFSGTEEAKVIAIELEKSKSVLASLLADAGMVDEVVKETGGNLGEIVKMLGFTSPMLRKDNALLANINAGLDKTGKALKFQRRDQEIINYTFQLMGRHIGQLLKRWMLMLNPISLIKKAFSDFASYDVKWQRTMNVIKYNIRRIIKPFMEWIAQQIVNIIGLVNALIKGIGKAFGKDWDLFDKEAADAEKMREELEAAANVTAGFDELHDIGGDSSNPAMDFLSEDSDIYTPQWDSLYQGIQEFGEKVATVFKTIYDTVSGWNFWDWLAVGAGVVGGVLLFKWLIGLFTNGKNPVQSVADGFKSLEKLGGLALVIWAISSLTTALKDFIDTVSRIEKENILKSLGALGYSLAIIGIVIIGLLVALAAVISTGVGALAVFGLAAIVAAIALVIWAIKDLTTVVAENSDEIIRVLGIMGILAQQILNTIGDNIARIITTIGETVQGIIQRIGDVISQIIDTIVTGIQTTITTIGDTIVNIVQGVADAVMTVLQPIIDFIDGIIDKVVDLATTIAHEIGETIRTIIETVGDIILEIIHEIVNAIPNLLDSILNFCKEIGPAIEGSVDSMIRSITKLVNFVVSAVEYITNLVIGAVNSLSIDVPNWVPGLGGTRFGFNLQPINIPRFIPRYEKGTNYVPNDGLAYLHQGEAVVPKKYNQPYNQGLSNEERAYMQQMITTMRSLDGTIKQGIPVSGQFVQRGSDLVAVVNKTNSQTGANLLSNVSYAR